MKEQIEALIRQYESQLTKIFNNGYNSYGAGYADGRESELKSVIEDLKELIGEKQLAAH